MYNLPTNKRKKGEKLMLKEAYSCEQINMFNNSVTKLNNLIEAKYELTASEQKIVLLLASMVQPDDEDFKMYKFRLAELITLLGLKSKGSYATIERTVTNLMKQVFEVKMPENNKWIKYQWVIKSAYDGESGHIYMQLHPDLKTFFLKLKQNFTTFKLFNVLDLKSAYSIRLYELLKQYQPIGQRRFLVTELKEILCVEDKYNQYNNFKRVCILRPQEEIKEKTDIRFEFEEIKKGKAVHEIIFTIISQNSRINIIKQAFNMFEMYPTNKQLKQLEVALKNIPDEELIPICLQLKTAADLGNIHSPIGLLLSDPDGIAKEIRNGTFNQAVEKKKPKKKTALDEYELYIPPKL